MELFSDFNPVSKKSWQNKIKADLDLPFEKLIRTNSAGINVHPFYSLEDDVSCQANFQHQRLNIEDPVYGPNKWLNNQKIIVRGDVKLANQIALESLEGGADAITFSLPEGFRDFELLFSGIQLKFCFHLVEIEDKETFHVYQTYIDSLKLKEVMGAVDLYHLDNFFEGKSSNLDCTFAKNIRLIINTDYLIKAGASPIQEGAILLSFLNYLIESMPKPERLQFLIRLNIGSDLFLEISKIRALRYMSNKVLEKWGFKTEVMIEGHSTIWNKTIFDPYVNMLRQTNESFAAVCAGVDILTSGQYLDAKGEQSALGYRQARNISHLLKYESHLDKVSDPGAGSYYIENLTYAYASDVWSLFQAIEIGGGIENYNEENDLLTKFQTQKNKLQDEVSSGKTRILGTNTFPNPKDKLTKDDLRNMRSDRLAYLFESYRIKIDKFCLDYGEDARPKAILLRIGDDPLRFARSTFALNFLETAGISCFEMAEEDLSKREAHFVVLCGSDEDYRDLNTLFISRIKAKIKANQVLVAGDPENSSQLKNDGIDFFIHRKSHLGNTLRELLKTFDFEKA